MGRKKMVAVIDPHYNKMEDDYSEILTRIGAFLESQNTKHYNEEEFLKISSKTVRPTAYII